jgi:GNAT superfamily N-acetyltransferase
MTAMDPALVHAWLAGRSRARGLPAPVADHGGWRVDTDGETELRRYVFAAAGPGLPDLLRTIIEPRVFVKLCADAATFRKLLPDGWAIVDANRMMVTDAAPAACDPPPGYTLALTTHDGVTHATIAAPDGDDAASGYAAEANGVFVYDRIVTSEAHRRRGLGRTVMRALGAARRDPASQQILTATDMGAALYAGLGWRTCCPYTTATRA